MTSDFYTESSTWEKAAFEALTGLVVPDFEYTAEELAESFDQLVLWLGIHYDNQNFYQIGMEAVCGWLKARHQTSFTELDRVNIVETLAEKQHDYGHDNILRHGVDGVLVRIWDKIARLKNLLARGTEAKNESIVDTWFDLIGYSVIGIMLEDGTFTLPLAADVKSDGVAKRELNIEGIGENYLPKAWNIATGNLKLGEPLWALLNDEFLGIESVTVNFGGTSTYTYTRASL